MNIKDIKKYIRDNNILLVDGEIPVISYGGKIALNVIDFEGIEVELKKIDLEHTLDEIVAKEGMILENNED